MLDSTPAIAGRQRVLRLSEVRLTTGLSRSMIYQLEAERRFPRRFKIGARAVGWAEGEIQTWVETRIKSGRATSP